MSDPFSVPERPSPPESSGGWTQPGSPPGPPQGSPPGPSQGERWPPPPAWGQGSWPPAPVPPPPPHAEPQPYHRVLHTRTYSWWRPILGLAIFALVFTVSAVALVAATMIAEVIRSGGDVGALADEFLAEVTPLVLLGTNLSLAAAIPATMLAVLAAHRLSPGWLGSVVGRLRWRIMGRFFLLATAVVVAFTIAGMFIPVDDTEVAAVEPVGLSEFAAFAVVIVLTTPLQAAGEEYAFRGYGMQALGAYFRWPWVPALITSLLFAFAHGGQNLPLFLDRLAFGLVAAWLVVRTGGLEAPIALHTMNNVLAFLVAAAFGQITDSLEVSEAPWEYVMLDIGQLLVFAVLVERFARRRKLARVTRAG